MCVKYIITQIRTPPICAVPLTAKTANVNFAPNFREGLAVAGARRQEGKICNPR